MKSQIIEYNMFNGEKKTEITNEESVNVESVTIRQTMDKEEALEYLGRQLVLYSQTKDRRTEMVRNALDNINGLIIATWDPHK